MLQMMRSFRTILLAFVTLAAAGACGESRGRVAAPGPADPPRSPAQNEGTPATCDASRVQWAIGQPSSAALLDKARKDAGASTARFLRPNEPVTLEFLGTRLNLALTEQGVVQSAHCG